MVIPTSTTCVYINSTKPTPVQSTSLTVHSITSTVFLHSDAASWAISSVSVQCRPDLEANCPRNLTPTTVPWVPTLKTNWLTADAHGLIFATAWLLNHVFTVGARAPLFAFVLAYFKIFFDSFVFVLNFLGAKFLHLFNCKFLFAKLLRARNAVYFLHRHQNFKVVGHTVDAEAVVTLETEEIFIVVSFVANIAHAS